MSGHAQPPGSAPLTPYGRFDPLAVRRGTDGSAAPAFDLFLQGMVFLDIIFTGPATPCPAAGQEIWAEGMGSCPGGIANLAVATSRLGTAHELGGGVRRRRLRRVLLAHPGAGGHRPVDLKARYPGWHSPVTVSMAIDGDRNMVTHGHEEPSAPR